VGWGFLWVIFFGLGFAGVGAYAVYKYRLRVSNPASFVMIEDNFYMYYFAIQRLRTNIENERLILVSSIMSCQSYMDSEIRAIMAQYMPLENQDTSSHQRPVEHADI
jgi:hypothetical protein